MPEKGILEKKKKKLSPNYWNSLCKRFFNGMGWKTESQTKREEHKVGRVKRQTNKRTAPASTTSSIQKRSEGGFSSGQGLVLVGGMGGT